MGLPISLCRRASCDQHKSASLNTHDKHNTILAGRAADGFLIEQVDEAGAAAPSALSASRVVASRGRSDWRGCRAATGL